MVLSGSKYQLISVTILFAALFSANAQTVQPPESLPAASEAPAEAASWRIGPFDVSGLIDAYYAVSLNHPAGQISVLRDFDDRADRMALNMASMTLDYAPKPLGIHLEAGFGHAFDVMSATEKDATGMRYFKQAYLTVKPPSWWGVEIDFGKFATSAGAEVIETSNNWNYSRSLLFTWLTPYYHFGLRASAPLGKRFAAGVQLVSGWNNIVTGATYKTIGWSGAWTPTPRVTWTNTYYGGPDENKADRGRRNLYDSVLVLTPSSRTSVYLNFDYLHDSPRFTPAWQAYGVAGALKLAVSRKLALGARLEWLNDNAGMATGTAQQAKEFTVSGTYTIYSGVSALLEFRGDRSNRHCFNRGSETGVWGNQPTVLLGLVAVLARKDSR